MLVETKCDVGDKIYFIFGNPKKNVIVFSGIINKISIFTGNNIMYSFTDVKLELDKGKIIKEREFVNFGFFYEKDLDKVKASRSPTGMSNWPTFTSKEKCKEYIRSVLDKD